MFTLRGYAYLATFSANSCAVFLKLFSDTWLLLELSALSSWAFQAAGHFCNLCKGGVSERAPSPARSGRDGLPRNCSASCVATGGGPAAHGGILSSSDGKRKNRAMCLLQPSTSKKFITLQPRWIMLMTRTISRSPTRIR